MRGDRALKTLLDEDLAGVLSVWGRGDLSIDHDSLVSMGLLAIADDVGFRERRLIRGSVKQLKLAVLALGN